MFYNHYNNYMNLEKFINKYNIQFEYVLNLRSDINIQQELNLQNLNNNSFNIPKGYDCGGINDRFCYMSYHLSSKYFTVYEKIHDYVSKKKVVFHPESLLFFHIKNYPINRFVLSYNLSPNRYP